MYWKAVGKLVLYAPPKTENPQALAGALVVLAGLPEFIKPIPFPVPLGLTIGLLLPDLLLRRAW